MKYFRENCFYIICVLIVIWFLFFFQGCGKFKPGDEVRIKYTNEKVLITSGPYLNTGCRLSYWYFAKNIPPNSKYDTQYSEVELEKINK